MKKIHTLLITVIRAININGIGLVLKHEKYAVEVADSIFSDNKISNWRKHTKEVLGLISSHANTVVEKVMDVEVIDGLDIIKES